MNLSLSKPVMTIDVKGIKYRSGPVITNEMSCRSYGGEVEFDPYEEMIGRATPMGAMYIKLTLGPGAFESPGWLASCKLHLFTNYTQIKEDRWPVFNNPFTTPYDPKKDEGEEAGEQLRKFHEEEKRLAKLENINKIEALDKMIENAVKNGLDNEELQAIKDVRAEFYAKLDSANRKSINNFKEKGEPYKLEIQSCSTKSVQGLTGKTELFVAGTVLSEERVFVTIRGTKTIEGNVVSAELNGKTTQAHTDKEGHAILDMSAIATGLTGTAIAAIKIADMNGNPIASATTNVQKGYPMIFNRPEIEKLPDNVASGEVVTISGNNLGADANLVLGEQFQEILTASNKEISMFTDSKTGAQTVYIITPNGVSESQTVNVYSLDFRLPKSFISPKELVIAQVHYESIPAGTKLIFTNRSAETIKMNVPGAANSGNQSVYTVTSTNGTIPVNITGKTRGNFQIALDMEFKNGNHKPG